MMNVACLLPLAEDKTQQPQQKVSLQTEMGMPLTKAQAIQTSLHSKGAHKPM